MSRSGGAGGGGGVRERERDSERVAMLCMQYKVHTPAGKQEQEAQGQRDRVGAGQRERECVEERERESKQTAASTHVEVLRSTAPSDSNSEVHSEVRLASKPSACRSAPPHTAAHAVTAPPAEGVVLKHAPLLQQGRAGRGGGGGGGGGERGEERERERTRSDSTPEREDRYSSVS
jgi:hypothetical protein